MTKCFWVLISLVATFEIRAQELLTYSCPDGRVFDSQHECIEQCKAGLGRIGIICKPRAFCRAPKIDTAVVKMNEVPSTESFPSDRPCAFGFTRLERVKLDIDAVCDGYAWRAVLRGMTGEYSTRLRPRGNPFEVVAEPVTAASSNVTKANYCQQVSDLLVQSPCEPTRCSSDACVPTVKWISENAIDAHENVHRERFLTELTAIGPEWGKSIGSFMITRDQTSKTQALEHFRREMDRLKLEQKAWGDVMKKVMDAATRDESGRIVAEPDDAAARGTGLRAQRKLASEICALAANKGWEACPACRLINRVDPLER